MKNSMIDKKSIDEIEELIAKGLTDDALGKMRDMLKEHKSYSEVLMQSARYGENQEQYRIGVIDLRDYNLIRNRINHAIIELLYQLKKTIAEGPTYSDKTTQSVVDAKPSQSSIEQEFKTFGNLKTKMLPIFPYKREKPLKIENVIFDYYPTKVFDKNDYPFFYSEIENHVSGKKTIYNEAKPHLLDYKTTFSEEEQEHFMEIELGICGYLDFLSVSRNLDSTVNIKGLNTTIRKMLVDLDVDKDPTDENNKVPKQLGVSSIVVTSDNYVVLQKRQKSEVASKMYHVSIAEGLQAYPSYKGFLNLENSEKKFSITDKTLGLALYRGLEEELGIDDEDVKNLELLSIYFDYELQQPIFQTCTYLGITSEKLKQYYKSMKGRDTLAEVKRLDFIPFSLDEILLYLYQTTQEGRWSSHAIINIISFLERNFGSEKKLKPSLNKYFRKSVEFYLGDQRYVESIRN